jgi:hypothetical protein
MIDGEVGVQQCVLFSGQSGAGAEVVREARPSRHDVDNSDSAALFSDTNKLPGCHLFFTRSSQEATFHCYKLVEAIVAKE